MEADVVIGVDVGGTCTDCVISGDRLGGFTVSKVFTTPADLTEGVLAALSEGAKQLNVTLSELLRGTRLFLHSTTVAENAIADGKLERSALICSRGFGDTLSATRGGYGRWSWRSSEERRDPLRTYKPSPLVPRHCIHEVPERVDRWGKILEPLDRAEVRRIVIQLRREGVRSIGVCLLWSTANGAHECEVRELILQGIPDAFVSLSHELAPVVGEYERMSTVALNSCLGPPIASYLQRLTEALRGGGFEGRVLLMQSNGGVIGAERARSRPVGMIESGPAGALIGSLSLAERLGTRNLVMADIGGTTAKVGVIREGEIEYERDSHVFGYHFAIPKVNITSLEVAGGSIVSIDPQTGLPRVGPRSAGASPGPVVYGRGGFEPTVTDIDAILGLMNPRFFLGGRETLRVERARSVFEERIARPLGLDVMAAAAGIYRFINALLFDLLHRTTVQRGLDPRRFTLVCTGGTSGMHLPMVGLELGFERIVVPYTAAVQGAFGLVASDVIHETATTFPGRLSATKWSEINTMLRDMERKILPTLQDEGFGPEEIRVDPWVDLRFWRQVHQLRVPLRQEQIGNLRDLEGAFRRRYERRYGPGSWVSEALIEFVSCGVRAAGKLPPRTAKRSTIRGPEAREDPEGGQMRWRMFLPYEEEEAVVAGYVAEALPAGSRIDGPSLIWSSMTTVFLGSRCQATIDVDGNIVITPKRGSR